MCGNCDVDFVDEVDGFVDVFDGCLLVGEIGDVVECVSDDEEGVADFVVAEEDFEEVFVFVVEALEVFFAVFAEPVFFFDFEELFGGDSDAADVEPGVAVVAANHVFSVFAVFAETVGDFFFVVRAGNGDFFCEVELD